MLFYASHLLYHRYIIILSSEYEFESSKYHVSMIFLFLFYHYLLKDKMLKKINFLIQTFMIFYAHLYSVAIFYTNLTKFMLNLKFYAFLFYAVWEA